MLGLNLVVLRCADLEGCRRFYECFGMAFVVEQHGRGPVHFSSAGPGGVFELYPAGDHPSDRTGLGFAVADLVATADRLRGAGSAPEDVAATPWGESFVVRDPDGRRIEVQAVEEEQARDPR